MKRTLAFVVGAFLAGGVLGAWAFRAPAYEHHEEKTVALQQSHDGVKLDDSWAWNSTTTTGPREIIKIKRVYLPSPDGGCALASEETTTEKTGPGSIAISSDQVKHAEGSRDFSLLNTRETLTITIPPPVWEVAVLAGVDLKLNPQGAITGSYAFANIKSKDIQLTVHALVAGSLKLDMDNKLVLIGFGVRL